MKVLPLLAVAALTGGLEIACAVGCEPPWPHEPRHFLAITHAALDRVTFFDLDAHRVVGALPAQKLPHDMLLSGDQASLDVVCTGAQNMTRYHLDSPQLWRLARAFMRRDTVHAGPSMSMLLAMSHGESGAAAERVHPGRVIRNPDPVQDLPGSVAEFHLTDPTFPAAPESVRMAHARVHASEHSACFDCHARSHGGKPFGARFSADGREIELVHLAYRNITLLDVHTLAVRRTIPLDVPPEYSPVELWHEPGTDTALVTCRNQIGMSRPGRILVVDLASGHTVKSIEAGIYPWHMLPDPAGRFLYIDNFQSSRISVFDIARKQIVDSLIVQNGPSTMAFTPKGDKLLVACFYTHHLLVVDPVSHAIDADIAVGANPTSILFLREPHQALVLCGGESDIERVDWGSRRVLERWPVLFGAYAFQLVDRDHSGRWIEAAGNSSTRTPGSTRPTPLPRSAP